jgi:hypothetical protein
VAAFAAKVDFPSVRASLHPVLTQEAQKVLERVQVGGSGLGALLSQIRGDVLPKVVEAALETVITPENVMQIARNREALREALRRIMAEQVTLGGLVGGRPKKPEVGGRPAPETSGSQASPGMEGQEVRTHPRYRYDNIKSLTPVGPLAFDIGVNRRAEATEPEVIVRMAFTGTDWKIVGLVPRL